MIYLDTSAWVKLHLLEPDSNEVQEMISSQADPLPIWELQEMELTNALRLKVFWGGISEADSDRQLALFEQRKQKGHCYSPTFPRNSTISFMVHARLLPPICCLVTLISKPLIFPSGFSNM